MLCPVSPALAVVFTFLAAFSIVPESAGVLTHVNYTEGTWIDAYNLTSLVDQLVVGGQEETDDDATESHSHPTYICRVPDGHYDGQLTTDPRWTKSVGTATARPAHRLGKFVANEDGKSGRCLVIAKGDVEREHHETDGPAQVLGLSDRMTYEWKKVENDGQMLPSIAVIGGAHPVWGLYIFSCRTTASVPVHPVHPGRGPARAQLVGETDYHYPQRGCYACFHEACQYYDDFEILTAVPNQPK